MPWVTHRTRIKRGDNVNKSHQDCTRPITFLILALTYPFMAYANTTPMTGVAGPAGDLNYSCVAEDAGLWKKHGLDTRVVLFESASTLAQVARSGEFKFVINSGATTIASRA